MEENKLKILKIGTVDENGIFSGWVLSGDGIENPSPGITLVPGGQSLLGGYTAEDLLEIIKINNGK